MKYLIPLLISAFFITACDQKATPDRIDCKKTVSNMTDAEKNQCGKGGEYSKSPEKKW